MTQSGIEPATFRLVAQHSRETAVLCCGLEKNGMVGTWHGHGMASVNQTCPHCVNQMGKTHYKTLAARHGGGTAWARHAMCESAFSGQLFQVELGQFFLQALRFLPAAVIPPMLYTHISFNNRGK